MNHPSPRIHNLIVRFLRKELSDAEIAELQAWLILDKDNAAYFDRVNKLFQAEQAIENFSEDKLKAAWGELQSKIDLADEEKIRPLHVRVFQSTFAKVAATICILALVIWKVAPEQIKPLLAGQNTVLTNNTDRKAAYMLPDSTTVWLNANSSLEYSPEFLNSRRVTLKGEAFFDVTKKDKKNFVVTTSTLSIEVKGTRFNVRAYDSDQEKATLEEGKIELTLHGGKEKYAMSPGEQIIIDKAKQTVKRKRVDVKNFTAWKESQLVFDNTTLADIIVKLENRFNVKITIDTAVAQRERLSMTVEGETLQDILEMIRLSSALNYKTENETIIIYE